MKKVIIIGAGGHGREVAEILRHQQAQGENLILHGFVDDNDQLHGKQVDGLTVLGGWPWLEKVVREEISVICAIAFPEVRKRVVGRAENLGLSFASAVSPQAYISPRAKLGQGVMIFPFTFLSTEVEIGDHTIVHTPSFIGHDTRIAPYTTICPGVNVAGNVRVGEGCWLGIGSNIIQGRTIGEGSLIGAGSAVIRDIPSLTLAVGVPARAIKTREAK
jgi:sugar O-acyltransferase (sialic acid O-acetyltransferase NeuD family)